MTDKPLTPKQKLKAAASVVKEHQEQERRARKKIFERVCEQYTKHLNDNADAIDNELQDYIKRVRFHIQVGRSDILRIPDAIENLLVGTGGRKGEVYKRVLDPWVKSRYEGSVEFRTPSLDTLGDMPELVLKTDIMNGAR